MFVAILIELLEQYDPFTTKSEAISTIKNGIGAARKCEVLPSGWFKEQITEWEAEKAITFELVECSLPVNNLKHSYVLKDLGGKTHISQCMQYELKYGLAGRMLDKFIVRKKWDKGIKLFFNGLKEYAEKEQGSLSQ